MKVKRIMAMAGVVLLLLMYVVIFILAFMDIPNWNQVFIGGVAVTIIVPIIIWINIYLYDRIIASRRSSETDSEE